ncbi:MAG TPA: hypothetical protein PKL31_14335 [Fulvivirga sp.]|nr:hypothetical protein [Fulvivirga sp.]
MKNKPVHIISIGAGVGMIFGAVLGNVGFGLVIGAMLGLVVSKMTKL